MFSLEFAFDVKLSVDKKDKNIFNSILYCITLDTDIGEIVGSITRDKGKKIFTIDTSEVNGEYNGIGIGFKYYTETIRKCFDYGCTEFRSSKTRNNYSDRVWEKLKAEFYNIEKHRKQYIVSLPVKQIL